MVINDIQTGVISGSFYWNAEINQSIDFPHIMLPQDTITVRVFIGIPVDYTGDMIYDSLLVETEASMQYTILGVDRDLVGTDEYATEETASNLPKSFLFFVKHQLYTK